MKRAMLWVALASAALTGSAAALAQNAAAPAAEAALPPGDTATSPGPAPGPIAALQQQLKREGYRPGPVNGVMTEETRRALTTYQRRTGRLPDALQGAAPGGVGADPVKRAQAALQRLGLFAGPVDGVVGPKMRDAIIRFEATRHLAVDPRVSDRLLAALDEAGPEVGTTPPPSPGAARQAAPASQAQPAEPEAQPEAIGRRPLPPGVNPPPIR